MMINPFWLAIVATLLALALAVSWWFFAALGAYLVLSAIAT